MARRDGVGFPVPFEVPVLALVPYIQIPSVTIPLGGLDPLVLDPWAALVCIGFIAGLEVSRARGIRLGLDVRDIVDGIVFIVGMGFVVGHLVHVLAYNQHLLVERGWTELLRLWGGFSSTGGFIGAVLGGTLFYKVVRKRSFWIHADAVVFGFPIGWVFGRTGCFLAHDHIGKPSEFFLAVNYPGGARHDLGLYEAMWTAVIAITFFALRNRPFRPGFFLALFAAMYAPARFGFDFLRNTDLDNADVRWAGLTPAQWGMLVLSGAAVWLLLRLRGPGERVDPNAPPAALSG